MIIGATFKTRSKKGLKRGKKSNNNQKKADVAMFMSNKIYFKVKSLLEVQMAPPLGRYTNLAFLYNITRPKYIKKKLSWK